MTQVFPIRSPWRRYGVALLIVAVATIGRFLLTPHFGARLPYLTFFPAVTFAALLGGRGPGFAATAFSAVMIMVLWLEPIGNLHVQDPLFSLGTIVFLISAVTVTLIADAMHRAYARLGATLQALRKANRLLYTEIEDRKRIEEQLLAARETAEAASQAKDRFLATLSHELRTPLTPALMIAGTVERSADLPPELRTELATIRANIELEARIIDDLLDVTRITQNKLKLELQPCNAHSLLDRAEQILRNEVSAKHLVFNREFEAQECHVQADPVRLQQVFWNVLKNAVKFTPLDGRITIRTSNCDHAWRLSVSDTGIGIRAADLPRIFDAFAQAEEAAAPHFGGLGLGLTISSFLMQKQGGRIWAESPGPKMGATFHLEVPLAPQVLDDATEPVCVDLGPHRRARILLVEDHQPTRETLIRLLGRRGHGVTGAGSIAEARILAQPGIFDLIISDLGLPDGDGYNLMQELHRAVGLPGIALSGYGMESDVRQSMAAGFQEHLTKPVDLQTLEQAVARVLKHDTAGVSRSVAAS